MTAFVLLISLLSFGFAHWYSPPSPEFRLFPSLSPSTSTLTFLLASNTLICLAWRVGPLWPLLTKYFMHVPGYPRAFQALGNIFSHVQYEHLFSNMMMLALLTPAAHDLVGRGVFLGTYVTGGAVGTLVSLYWANLGRGSITAHSVGASAAIWAVAVLFCLLTEKDKVQVPFVSTEVAFWPRSLIAAFVAWEVAMAARRRTSSMDHASHFGGMLVGAGVAGWMRVGGFHQRREGGEGGTVDVGGMVKGEVDEVVKAVKGE